MPKPRPSLVVDEHDRVEIHRDMDAAEAAAVLRHVADAFDRAADAATGTTAALDDLHAALTEDEDCRGHD